MVLLAFRHGLRAGEICDLRWEQVDFKTASLHVRRLKNGTPSTHPLTGRERTWEAPLPQDMQGLLDALEGDRS